MLPIQITIRDIPNSAALEDHIRKKVLKLTHYYQRINSCRIVIHVPQKHKHNGKLFSVRIDLTVPGKELAVNHKLDEDVYVAIRDAFRALQRQLEQYVCKKRGYVKNHEAVLHGKVKKLFTADGYGFIQGQDGNEYYFSLNSVCHPNSKKLEIGSAVEFFAVPGGDGLHAHHIVQDGHKENGKIST